eukprot:TRINITY_DN11671_c0_g1_i3.p1 TRINITY_DN11671_c0_g1~~TRINITY_DN11671_c0_g1_i3.p1  ORF type:complete len:420 (+),score=109.22 TRINITY_DN11671_c0_g1_i3:81-1340(+)
MAAAEWLPLRLRGERLSLRQTLCSGQVFQWKEFPDPAGAFDRFVGVLHGGGVGGRAPGAGGLPPLLCDLRQPRGDSASLQWRLLAAGRGRSPAPAAVRAALSDFFQLGVPAGRLLREEWLRGDAPLVCRLREVTAAAAAQGWSPEGFRVLRQDPESCLLAFLCSQNNNTKRIGLMLDRLSERYGEELHAALPAFDFEGRRWWAFPTAERLLSEGEATLEAQLRSLGFGYRAPYAVSAVRRIVTGDGAAAASGGPRRGGWLGRLRRGDTPYADVVAALTGIDGIGRKVADCVALFSLDRPEVIPVDVHILAVAREHVPELADLGVSTLTPKAYDLINAAFRKAFGPHAGWAHSLLFHAELTAAPRERQLRRRKVAETAAARAAAQAGGGGGGSKGRRRQGAADAKPQEGGAEGGKRRRVR